VSAAKYSVLRQSADDENDDMRVIAHGAYKTKAEAMRAAKKVRASRVAADGSWADRFFVARLEEA
jgi:hypothetical protein